MAQSLDSLEERVVWLADELLLVKEQVNSINNRLQKMGAVSYPSGGGIQGYASKSVAVVGDGKSAGESWAKMGEEILLPRLAAVSFMLVVALLLRTVTNNGMLAPNLGTFIGLAYAAALILGGWLLYSRQIRLASVFPTCGILLLYAVLLEGHGKIAALGSDTTYLVLFLAMLVSGVIALRYQGIILLFMTVWGASIVGFAIDFRDPQFMLLGLVVLLNAVLGHLAKRREISTALRWNTLFFSIMFWMILSSKLNFVLLKRPSDLSPVSLEFFTPLLFLFWAFYTYTTLWTIRMGRMALEIYHNLLPIITAGGTFFVAYAVLIPWLGGEVIIGIVAVASSVLYMGLVVWVERYYGNFASGKTFVVAAIVLLVQGLSISAPSFLALPIMVVAATALLVRSRQCHSGGIRVIAYFFHIAIVLWAIKENAFEVTLTHWGYGMVLSGFWAVCCLWAYRWCRINPPVINSGFFDFIDRDDCSAVVLLLLGLFQVYIVVYFAAFGILSNMMMDYTEVLYCVRSIVMNLAVIILMIVALKLRNKEILLTSGVVFVLAAVKVFIFDLFRTSGLPLILSVLTFGIVAAVSSVVLRKWGQFSQEVST